MSASRTHLAAQAAVLALLVLTLLGGCASRQPAAKPADAGKDIVTASDETESAKRARLRMELATAYFGQGQMTTALDEVKQALQADPNLVAAYDLRGLIYANLGDDKLADESFQHALQLNAKDADSLQNYGYYLCKRKRYAEANTMFDQALALPNYRDASRTLLTKGVCQAFAGQLPEADATLSRAYELDPSNPAISMNLAEVLYRRGEYERARYYIRRVNSVPAVSGAQSLWLAARIEQRLGNRSGAQDFGEQLHTRFPESREAALFAQGRFNE